MRSTGAPHTGGRLVIGLLAAVLIGSALVPVWHDRHGLDFDQDCTVCKLGSQLFVACADIEPLRITEPAGSAPVTANAAAAVIFSYVQAPPRAPPV